MLAPSTNSEIAVRERDDAPMASMLDRLPFWFAVSPEVGKAETTLVVMRKTNGIAITTIPRTRIAPKIQVPYLALGCTSMKRGWMAFVIRGLRFALKRSWLEV